MIVYDQEYVTGRRVVIRLCGRRYDDHHPDRVKNFDTAEITVVDMAGPTAPLWRVIGDRLENRWALRAVHIFDCSVQFLFGVGG